jgi:predicted O-methyltransferase YrrM
MNKTVNVDFIVPTVDENNILNQLDNSYTEVSEMSPGQRAFLNALILRNKPKKLLELGVSAGGSSIIILNSIKDFSESRLYSVDLNDKWYRDTEKRTGFFVDNYSHLKSKWELFTGGLALNFLDKITWGGGIDFCLIDTVHTNPGEIFDVLMVLPFLEENATIVFHDTTLHTRYSLMKKYLLGERAITNNLLMSSITGKKILQGNYEGEYFSNIAGIKINKNTKENIFEIFNLLMIRWYYIPTEKQEQEIISWFDKYYNEYYINYLKKVFSYQKIISVNDNRYKHKMKEIIKKILGEKNILRIKKLLRKM